MQATNKAKRKREATVFVEAKPQSAVIVKDFSKGINSIATLCRWTRIEFKEELLSRIGDSSLKA